MMADSEAECEREGEFNETIAGDEDESVNESESGDEIGIGATFCAFAA